MPQESEPYEQADIRVGEVIWSKTTPVNDIATQQKHLSELAEKGETGVVLDCASVEIANSELLNLLVRVRTLTTKQKKGFALFNVNETLSKSIKACKLSPLLPVGASMPEAKKLVYDAVA